MGDLQISPNELKFRFELRKTIPVTLSLTNPGKEKIAFKVKTTSPKKYCVRPSSGVVEPGSSKDVQVIMQVLSLAASSAPASCCSSPPPHAQAVCYAASHAGCPGGNCGVSAACSPPALRVLR